MDRSKLVCSYSHKTSGGSICPLLLTYRTNFLKQYLKFFFNLIKVHCTFFVPYYHNLCVCEIAQFSPSWPPSKWTSSLAQLYTTHFFNLLFLHAIPEGRKGFIAIIASFPTGHGYSLSPTLRASHLFAHLCSSFRRSRAACLQSLRADLCLSQNTDQKSLIQFTVNWNLPLLHLRSGLTPEAISHYSWSTLKKNGRNKVPFCWYDRMKSEWWNTYTIFYPCPGTQSHQSPVWGP